MLDGSMYSNGIFTNKISQDLRVTEETIQGAASLEVVVSALMCFVASFITQKCGPKVVASWGALIAVLGWLGASYVPNLTLLIICQSLVVGSGFGCMYVPGVVAVGNSFKKNRSRALGLVTFSSALGQIGVSLAAGLLLDRWGWQVFICKMFACVVCGCLVFSILLIPTTPAAVLRLHQQIPGRMRQTTRRPLKRRQQLWLKKAENHRSSSIRTLASSSSSWLLTFSQLPRYASCHTS